jgi:hypothetical protein
VYDPPAATAAAAAASVVDPLDTDGSRDVLRESMRRNESPIDDGGGAAPGTASEPVLGAGDSDASSFGTLPRGCRRRLPKIFFSMPLEARE